MAEAKTRRERADIRLSGMKAERKPYEADWQEIMRLALPSRGMFMGERSQSSISRRANTTTHDSHGARAARRTSNGMQTGLSSQAQPWFKLQTTDRDMMEFQPVKEWIAHVEKLIYDLFASTNFYDSTKVGYSELCTVGVEACVMLEHSEYKAVCHPLTAGEFWIATDHGLRVDTLYRHSLLTVAQMVSAFAWDKLSKTVRDAYDKSNYQMLVPTMHAIEPNKDRQSSKMDGPNKAFSSIVWEEGQDKKDILLREGGYDTKPFWAPRWETTSSEVYSSASPGYYALPDLREMQLIARNRGRARDLLIKPPIKAPIGMSGSRLRLDPGSVTFGSALDLDKVGPMFELGYQSLAAIRDESESIRRDVDECFFVDLFMAISQREGVQPLNDLEAQLRESEKFTQLGPVVDRVNIEKLEVSVDRAYAILDNLNLLPPPPEELHGQPLTIDFISTLAQAQRASQNSAIERAARFVGFVAGIYPDAALKFDAEQAIDEFATGTGTPPKIIRSDEVVEKMRADMQQQQQQQQMIEAAPAARDAAGAAELLSRTNVGNGATALQQMLGQ